MEKMRHRRCLSEQQIVGVLKQAAGQQVKPGTMQQPACVWRGRKDFDGPVSPEEWNATRH